MQSRAHSILEALANTAVGYGIGLASQMLVFPLVGIAASLAQNLEVSAWFTGISLLRQYVLRRWFTRRTEAGPVLEPRDQVEVDIRAAMARFMVATERTEDEVLLEVTTTVESGQVRTEVAWF